MRLKPSSVKGYVHVLFAAGTALVAILTIAFMEEPVGAQTGIAGTPTTETGRPVVPPAIATMTAAQAITLTPISSGSSTAIPITATESITGTPAAAAPFPNLARPGDPIGVDTAARVGVAGVLVTQQAAYTVAFSPDGSRLAMGGDDGLVRIWRLADGVLLRALPGHDDSVWSVAFGRDGKMLASGGDDGTIRLWDTDDGSLLNTLKGHTKAVLSLAFSPNGQILASGSADSTIRLWSVTDAKETRVLESHSDSVWSIAFSPDGSRLVSLGEDGAIIAWQAQ